MKTTVHNNAARDAEQIIGEIKIKLSELKAKFEFDLVNDDPEHFCAQVIVWVGKEMFAMQTSNTWDYGYQSSSLGINSESGAQDTVWEIVEDMLTDDDVEILESADPYSWKDDLKNIAVSTLEKQLQPVAQKAFDEGVSKYGSYQNANHLGMSCMDGNSEVFVPNE